MNKGADLEAALISGQFVCANCGWIGQDSWLIRDGETH